MKKLVKKIQLKISSPVIGRITDNIRNDLNSKFSEMELKLDSQLHIIKADQKTVAGLVQEVKEDVARVKYIEQADYDNLAELTRELHKLRKKDGYKNAFKDKPLVSVRVATFNRADVLIEKAINSILKQTYQNFEIVIVGDHCTDDTEKKLSKLNDKRIRFYNLPTRTVYPENRILKWRVIGTPAMNMAASLAKGEWIAPLDDDDEFSPDHIEKLLRHAQSTACEMVYGATTQRNLATKEDKIIWSSPPEAGMFTFIGAMYMKALDEIFKYDFKAWVMDEVNDWNMCRRMMESGVKISNIKDVIGTIYMIPPGHSEKDY